MNVDLTVKEIDIIANSILSELVTLEYIKREKLSKDFLFSNDLKIDEINAILIKLKQALVNQEM